MAQKDWHTLSPSNFCQNVHRTSALVEIEPDLPMLQELWRSELSQVGMVCLRRNDLFVVDVRIVPVGSKWLVQ